MFLETVESSSVAKVPCIISTILHALTLRALAMQPVCAGKLLSGFRTTQNHPRVDRGWSPTKGLVLHRSEMCPAAPDQHGEKRVWPPYR